MLEENVVPTIWLSNSIRGMDPAFIRRFDVIFELTVPPKKQRERIIRVACENLLDDKQVCRIAEAQELAPAVVTRASSVVRSISAELGPLGVAGAIQKLICSTLVAQGHKPLRTNDNNKLPDLYDPDFIHADVDLVQVAAGLAESKSGRICLYGPPGTGKTVFGRWLADRLGIPLIVKRASDLMSMWVGESERNVAKAFKQAEEDKALLLIDEVDSFLQDRRTVTGVDFDLDPSVRMRRKWHNPCNGRHYQAELYQDLLGDWILIRTWRGDRHRGNEKMAVVASYQDGLDQISRIASIRTRRGYQLVGAHGNEHNGPPSTLP